MIIEHQGHSVYLGHGGLPWRAGDPTMLLLHGAGLDHTVWVLLGRYFARRGYNVVVPDFPAHGASAGAPLDTIEAHADWLLALLDALAANDCLSLDDMVMTGHSMGSLVALEASRRTTGIARLLLLGCAAPMTVGAALLDAARANRHAAIEMITLYSHSFAARIGHNRVAGINVVNMAQALLERAAPGVLYTDLAACNHYAGAVKAAQTVRNLGTKVTLIVGDSDRMTPMAASKRLHSEIQGSFNILTNCGHMMMSEQPEATLQAMRAALQ